MAFPSKGDQVVVDTHVLRLAAEQRRSQESGKGVPNGTDLEVLEKLVESCGVVRLSHQQVRSGDQRGELVARLRSAGFRRIAQSTILARLDAERKLRRTPRMRIDSDGYVGPHEGRKHANTTDDAHLTDAAREFGAAIVVTRDKNLLQKAARFQKDLGVTVLTPEEALSL
ncbi:MAG: hypothetical protein JST92_10430 [Deltaproteobacteria bacterium]|nr:hypothetical protein [Deltaproteobacteria bacterium]